MRALPLVTAALLGAAFLAPLTLARADEVVVAKDGRLLVFAEGAPRLRVVHDPSNARLVFRMDEGSPALVQAPVVLLKTDTGTQEVVLKPIADKPGQWFMTHDLLRRERYDGDVRIVVGEKTYTTSLLPRPIAPPAPRHSGRVLAFDACGAYAEIVQDAATGTLTVYSFDDVKIVEAPVVTVTETRGPAQVTFVAVEGQPGVWRVVHPSFKTTTINGRMRLLVNGKPCEASLRGGRVFTVAGGPRFEVVTNPTTHESTFYALDDTWNGKEYVIENPQVVFPGEPQPRVVTLTRVEGEPRAWRLVGLGANVREPFDGTFRFTLLGKTLETRLGISGLGLDLR